MEPLIPKIFVTDSVIAAMSKEVLAHPHEETAWGIYGLKLANGDLIITGVMEPSPHDIVRRYATASFGGEHAAAELTWLNDNWDMMVGLGLAPEGAQFKFLYKGHSHQHLDYARYSETDEQSILEAVRDDELEVAIGPLAICNVPDPRILRLKRGEGISFFTSQYVRFVFYYMDKAMVARGLTKPILIQPEVIRATEVPMTPPQGWQFTNQSGFERELQLIRNYGCDVVANFLEIEGGPPFEIQLVVGRPTWCHYLFITTHWDHPRTPPAFKLVAKGHAAASTLHFASSKALLEGEIWQPGQSLLEAIFRLEARGEL